jgi:hypothetical protein
MKYILNWVDPDTGDMKETEVTEKFARSWQLERFLLNIPVRNCEVIYTVEENEENIKS